MGLQHPMGSGGSDGTSPAQVDRPPRRRRRGARIILGLTALLSLVLLAGCGPDGETEWDRIAFPRLATEESWLIWDLWKWSWVAAMATGIIVWALIFYAIARFRRRSDDEIPVQTRYNLPLEIFYTFAPVIMVIVFFYHTVDVQNQITDEVDHPDHTVVVTAQQWQWTFNYTKENLGDDEYEYEDVADGKNVYEYGSGEHTPTLVLPVGETTEFELHSPDVVHSFWVTGFGMKLDVVPGRVNTFQATPNATGDFVGKCAELCGAYHSRMLFNVKIVSPEEYDTYLQGLVDQGNVSDSPLLGGEDADTQIGLEENEGAHQ